MDTTKIVPYHTALIRGYAEKHGVTITYLGYDDASGIWQIMLKSDRQRFGRYREARVLDVIRRIKEAT